MPDNNTVERAEQRVREMDRLTRQFSEQGNRYMQQMMNRRGQARIRSTDNVQDAVPESGSGLHNIPRVGKNGTRFEPVERKRDVPQVPPKAAETPKNEKKSVPPKGTQNAGRQQFPNGNIDGEKLLLAALMYLLIMENADIKLILAIAYLIL